MRVGARLGDPDEHEPRPQPLREVRRERERGLRLGCVVVADGDRAGSDRVALWNDSERTGQTAQQPPGHAAAGVARDVALVRPADRDERRVALLGELMQPLRGGACRVRQVTDARLGQRLEAPFRSAADVGLDEVGAGQRPRHGPRSARRCRRRRPRLPLRRSLQRDAR